VIRSLAIGLLVIAPPGAMAATSWLPPTAIAPPARGAGPPVVAGNDDGRAIAAWATRTGVMASVRTPGGPWYSPRRVPGSGRGATEVQVAMTGSGTAAVTWVQAGRIRTSIRPAGRRFLPAAVLSPRSRVAASPRVAFGRGCAPLVAWASEDSRGRSPSAVSAACGRADGRFARATGVSPQGESASSPAVAGGRTGVIVLWRQDDGAIYRVRSATRGPSGPFSPPDTVSPVGTGVVVDSSVDLAADGTAMAAWSLTRGGEVVAQAATRPVTGGWGPPIDLSRPAAQVRGTRMAMDAGGNAIATWSRAGVIQMARRPRGEAWSPPRDLSDPGLTAGAPFLAMSGGGAAVVTWPASTGGAALVQGALRPVGGEFTTAATISDARRPGIAPQGAIGDDGVAPVAWQWTDPVDDPLIAPSGVMGATGLAGSEAPGPATVVDLRARPARVRPGQAIRITFGLSSPSRVRITARRAPRGPVAGAISLSGADGANQVVLSGGLGGASLGRGRWVITATPRGGTARSLSLVVV